MPCKLTSFDGFKITGGVILKPVFVVNSMHCCDLIRMGSHSRRGP